ncbi:hypothetical protein JG687_00006962, partial [Phytophthora cactorum]
QQLREVACFEDEPVGDPKGTGFDRDEHFESRAFLPEMGRAERNAELVRYHLLKVIDATQSNGIEGRALDMLRTSLENYKAEFCVMFGMHHPVNDPPLRVLLKPHATPVRCAARRCAPMEQVLMDAHVEELEGLGLIERNYSSRWASAPRVVPKPEPGNFRMCIASRAVNVLILPMQWPMTQLDVAITHLAGYKVFFVCDWFRGYWQLPLHPDPERSLRS